MTYMYAHVAPSGFVSTSSNQLIEPRDGIHFVQVVFKYTDFGISRRLDNDIANSDRRNRQYRVLVTNSIDRLNAFGSRFFRGKTLVLAVSQSFFSILLLHEVTQDLELFNEVRV